MSQARRFELDENGHRRRSEFHLPTAPNAEMLLMLRIEGSQLGGFSLPAPGFGAAAKYGPSISHFTATNERRSLGERRVDVRRLLPMCFPIGFSGKHNSF